MSVSFIYKQDQHDVTKELQSQLLEKLTSHQRVTWLVPGGSNIALSVEIMKAVPKELRSYLTILQTDERFGIYDHPDSNWRQLREAGFDATGASVETILQESNLSLEDTVRRYGKVIETVFSASDDVIGQFGIGADGHIAGALPGSPAINSADAVVGYETADFTRVTLTMKSLRRMNTAYVFAFGDSKRETLDTLAQTDVALEEQPAQVIKQLPEAYVYSDQIKKG